ncbi:hypothetical protein C5167_026450 [Papaver somniferum]|nr:hypothetical protein C5167_026450 [Papaver somniferum]
MWKLKFADNGGPFCEWLSSTNNFVGRQTWEFDPEAGTSEERAEVEKARQGFYENRFKVRACGDVLLRLQVVWLDIFYIIYEFCVVLKRSVILYTMTAIKENKDKFDLSIPQEPNIGDDNEVTFEATTNTLRRGIRFFSAMQGDDDHWAANIDAPLFLMPPLNIGSQTWDASFALHALLTSNDLIDKIGPTLKKGHHFLKLSQGADGGFSAWEPATSHAWLEITYVDCTSSAIEALVMFKNLYPHHRTEEIETCIEKAVSYLEYKQEPNGSWYGNWGICYIYGTWFALRALSAVGKNYCNSSTVRKACNFLLSTRGSIGGWGEIYFSCMKKGERDPKPLHHAARVLINNQMENCDFPQQDWQVCHACAIKAFGVPWDDVRISVSNGYVSS